MPRIVNKGNKRRNARNTDPITSHIAAKQTTNKIADEFTVWLEFIRVIPRALATWELERRLGGEFNGRWRKRLCDLAADEWLIRTGEKRLNPESRREQYAWTVNPEKYRPAQ